MDEEFVSAENEDVIRRCILKRDDGNRLSRKEAATILRVSLPTLKVQIDSYKSTGRVKQTHRGPKSKFSRHEIHRYFRENESALLCDVRKRTTCYTNPEFLEILHNLAKRKKIDVPRDKRTITKYVNWCKEEAEAAAVMIVRGVVDQDPQAMDHAGCLDDKYDASVDDDEDED